MYRNFGQLGAINQANLPSQARSLKTSVGQRPRMQLVENQDHSLPDLSSKKSTTNQIKQMMWTIPWKTFVLDDLYRPMTFFTIWCLAFGSISRYPLRCPSRWALRSCRRSTSCRAAPGGRRPSKIPSATFCFWSEIPRSSTWEVWPNPNQQVEVWHYEYDIFFLLGAGVGVHLPLCTKLSRMRNRCARSKRHGWRRI